MLSHIPQNQALIAFAFTLPHFCGSIDAFVDASNWMPAGCSACPAGPARSSVHTHAGPALTAPAPRGCTPLHSPQTPALVPAPPLSAPPAACRTPGRPHLVAAWPRCTSLQQRHVTIMQRPRQCKLMPARYILTKVCICTSCQLPLKGSLDSCLKQQLPHVECFQANVHE
jgi:hypothetical protein